MKKLLTTLLAAAMLVTTAIPVFAADPEVPAAKSGDTTLTGATANGGWDITDDAITSTEKDSVFVFTNETMEAGKFTATIKEDPENPTNNGLVFCVSGDTNTFWENEVDSYYFVCVHKHEGVMKVSLCHAGNGFGWKGGLGGRYVIPEEDISETGTYTITAEWDCSGLINVYLEGELVITYTDSNPFQGTRFGLRAAQTGVSYSNIIAEPAEPAEGAIRNEQAEAIPGTVTVDGVIDEAWEDAPVYTLESVATADCTGDEATRKESSTVKFRMMYDESKVYVLFEINDNAWITNTNKQAWKNDSIMMFISENDAGRGTVSDNTYQLVAFLSEKQDGVENSGFWTRQGTNDKEKVQAVKIDGNNAVMELSFELNNETPVEGGMFAFDVQYNDQDSEPNDQNTRTIIWQWSSDNATGPNSSPKSGSKGWGNVYFVSAPETDNEGSGNEGSGNEGTGNEGSGNEGSGNEGSGNEGFGNEGTGNEGAGKPDGGLGDASTVAVMLAVIALAGVVVIARRRKVTE